MEHDVIAHRGVIVIGASAGGVGSLQKVMAGLPADLPAAIFVTLHLPESVRSALPQILTRAGRIEAVHAEDGLAIRAGRIYIAPPGFHLTLERTRMRVTRGAREHGHRPAIDPLFRSAALSFGSRVIGVILSGLLDDGTVGLFEVKRAGGIAVVQDPADTEWPSMPQSALRNVDVDHCLPADLLGPLLAKLVAAPPAPAQDPDPELAQELELLTMHEDEREHPGDPSPYSCPDCSGVLWETNDGDLLRFRCRVGHAYTSDTLTADQAVTVERALWTALRALEEQAGVKRRLGERAARQGRAATARQFESRAVELEQQARQVRDLLLAGVGAARTSETPA
jgi:two-component system chemotaxis response regulator CheB